MRARSATYGRAEIRCDGRAPMGDDSRMGWAMGCPMDCAPDGMGRCAPIRAMKSHCISHRDLLGECAPDSARGHAPMRAIPGARLPLHSRSECPSREGRLSDHFRPIPRCPFHRRLAHECGARLQAESIARGDCIAVRRRKCAILALLSPAPAHRMHDAARIARRSPLPQSICLLG